MLARLFTSNGRTFHPTADQRRTAFRLTMGLLLVCLLSAAPALPHLNLATAPHWARLVLLVTLLQAAYSLWMLTAPDWSSLWIAMIAFAIGAAMYGMGMAISLATPADHQMAIGLEPYRRWASAWSICMLLVSGGAAYVCGWTSYRWRKLSRNGQ